MVLALVLAGAVCPVFEGMLAKDVWEIGGDFGHPDGVVSATADGCAYAGEGYRIETKVSTDANGVTSRRTVLKNVSGRTIVARCLMDHFFLPGGEWEVYAQANSWFHESRGGWQPLVACAGARAPTMRGSHAAAPVLALWNRQENRGRVFHLLSDGAWEMLAYHSASGSECCWVCVDVGYDARYLNYELRPGEEIALPEVLSYDFTNRLDLDCHKLHAYWNARHPATRPQPVIYNSWLALGDKLDFDFLIRQVPKAKSVGVDYFVIDAGWFGPKAGWGSVRGDWEESPDGWLEGRLGDVSKAVRAAGMKFGLWVEPSSAAPGAKAVKEHPDWFLKIRTSYYYDFTNAEAFNDLVERICALVRKYDASFLKFDYNQNAPWDPTGRDFIAYNSAYRRFVREIRRRNPGIYIEGCAGGGYMMNLGWADVFDSFWLSDNQSPDEGIRIVKESMLRLLPRQIERWIVARSLGKYRPDSPDESKLILAQQGGGWANARAVSPSVLDAFAAGGPYCFSCDLTAVSERDLGRFAEVIAERRRDAGFWNGAVGRILCDTPTMLALQYADTSLDDVRIVVLPLGAPQRTVTVRPVLTPGAVYRVDGEEMTAERIAKEGLVLTFKDWGSNNRATFITLRKK